MRELSANYDNGKPRFEGKYRAGEMHGAWKFFRKDGSLMREGVFCKGKQVGKWRTFDRLGKLVKETDFGD